MTMGVEEPNNKAAFLDNVVKSLVAESRQFRAITAGSATFEAQMKALGKSVFRGPADDMAKFLGEQVRLKTNGFAGMPLGQAQDPTVDAVKQAMPLLTAMPAGLRSVLAGGGGEKLPQAPMASDGAGRSDEGWSFSPAGSLPAIPGQAEFLAMGQVLGKLADPLGNPSVMARIQALSIGGPENRLTPQGQNGSAEAVMPPISPLPPHDLMRTVQMLSKDGNRTAFSSLLAEARDQKALIAAGASAAHRGAAMGDCSPVKASFFDPKKIFKTVGEKAMAIPAMLRPDGGLLDVLTKAAPASMAGLAALCSGMALPDASLMKAAAALQGGLPWVGHQHGQPGAMTDSAITPPHCLPPVPPRSYALPPAGPRPVIFEHTTILDGRVIAKTTSEHLLREMNRPASGPSGFDGRAGFIQV